MKTTKILLNIMSVVCFIYGAFYLFSLVFIPVAVYCFLAGKRFSYKAEHLYDTFTVTNQTLKNIDVLVDGRFIEERKDPEIKFRGSDNQRLLNVKECLRENKIV